MKTNVPPAISQTSKLVEVNEEEEEEDGDNANDLDLEISNTNNTETQHAVVSGTLKDAPPGTSGMSFKKPNMQVKRKALKSDAISQLLSLETRKIEHLEKMHTNKQAHEELEKDEDYHFLMSLLPHLRDIPKRRKLATRVRLQQVLMDEEKMEEVRSPNSSASSCSHYTSPPPNANDMLHSYVSTYRPEPTTNDDSIPTLFQNVFVSTEL